MSLFAHFWTARSGGHSRSRGGAIEQIRILLVNLSRLVADMVERAVERQEDMAVVGSAVSLDEALGLARVSTPDVVVVGLHGAGLPAPCLELLMERPHTKVLGIEVNEGRAWLYVLRPDEVEIGEVSPDDVVEAIRRAVEPPSQAADGIDGPAAAAGQGTADTGAPK